MDVKNLESGIRLIGCSGAVLSYYEIESITIAVSNLKLNADRVYFWGRIEGIQGRYYILYVLNDSSEFWPEKKFFYSTNNFEFHELPVLPENRINDLKKLPNRLLQGDPQHLLSVKDENSEQVPENIKSEDIEEEIKVDIKDLDLLAFKVQTIDNSTAAVPRGAYRIHKDRKVIPAKEFQGYSREELKLLTNWVHFRPAFDLNIVRSLSSKDYQFKSEFLESLERDVPKRCWIQRYSSDTDTVLLRSLLYPGYVAYATVNTTNFGGVYFGDGSEYVDLPFLL